MEDGHTMEVYTLGRKPVACTTCLPVLLRVRLLMLLFIVCPGMRAGGTSNSRHTVTCHQGLLESKTLFLSTAMGSLS